MLDKLRRKGKWDWDAVQRPFFTPKHIRWASHVGKPKWTPEQEPRDRTSKAERDEHHDGFELSQREREWKDHMEALRKRINQDPYEAVFGRRFEPFWTPLVPHWMKEEMGLQSKDASETTATSNSREQKVESAKAPYRPLGPEPIRAKSQIDASDAASEHQSTPARYSYDPKKTSIDVNSDSPNGQQTSYSYGATTKWDSWTKKASRVEWDSVSGEKRRYEYDPISNRMVQVNGPPESEVRKVEDALKDYPARSQSPLMSHGWQSGLGNKTSDSAVVDVPITRFDNTRQAITVPTQDSAGQKASVYFPSLTNTSIVADAPKPSSLSKHERYPDTLTASDVRASMGQSKAERGPPTVREEERAYRHGKPDPRKMSQWEQAEHRMMLNGELYDITKQKQKLLKQESGSLENIQRDMAKLETRASDLHTELDAMDGATPTVVAAQAGTERDSGTSITAKFHNTSAQPTSKLQPALERMPAKSTKVVEDPDDSAAHESTGDFGGYNFHDIPKPRTIAARPAERIQRQFTTQNDLARTEDDSLRKSGTSMVELLREKRSLEDRVQGEVLGRKSAPRWIDVMKARQAAKDDRNSEDNAVTDIRDAAKNERLAKANALLQAEIDEQKSYMNAHEHRHPAVAASLQELPVKTAVVSDISQSERQRYQEKIRDLRKELDLAYKQSSTNAEGHVDTIRKLEKKLQTSLESRSDVSDAERKKYVKKIKALREELDATFKQSSINAEMHVERIRELEKESEQFRGRNKPIDIPQAEGDMSINVAKFAKDSSRWYKQPAIVHARNLQQLESDSRILNRERDAALSEHELRAGSAYERKANQKKQDLQSNIAAGPHPIDQALAEYERKAVQRERDQALVKEVRDIYEKQYGTIDVHHRQTSVDKALEEHERMMKPEPKAAPEAFHALDNQQPLPTSLDAALKVHEQKRKPQTKLEECETHPTSLDRALEAHEQKRTPQTKLDDCETRPTPLDSALEAYEQKQKPQTKLDDCETHPNPLDRALEAHEQKRMSQTKLDNYDHAYSVKNQEHDPHKNTSRLERQAREAEMAQQEKEAHDAQSAMDQEVYGTRSLDTDVQHPINAETQHTVQWQEPPIYKVLAYDSGNDFLVTSTTSTNFTGQETPISIPEALSQLYQPARFIPEFAELQKQNFQVIYATRDLLVLRKAKTTQVAAETTTLQDHGLIVPPEEPTSAESAPKVNPVDKTGLQEPVTGSFASPTGFVGDRWESEASTVSPETQAVDAALSEYEAKHYPRVTRQERVFSGSRLSSRGSSSSSSHTSNKKKEEKEQRRKYRGLRRSAKWALISGVGVGVAAYSIGAAAERSRERDMERWQRILQEQRALGGLGADGKRLRDSVSGVFWR